jgi:hypothetical protein
MRHVWVREELHTGFGRGNQKPEKYHLEGLGVVKRLIFKWFFKK